MFEPSEKAKHAEEILTADSFSSEKARELFSGLSQDELTWLSQSFMDYVFNLFFYNDELDSSLHPENYTRIENVAVDMEQRLRILIAAGLDPNHVFDEENPVWSFQYITEEHCLNARLLRILLENGGNQNIIPDGDDEMNLYEYVDIAIYLNEEGIDRAIPYLLMLTAFGGKTRYGKSYFIMADGHRIEELKDIEKLVWDCDSSTIHKIEEKTFTNYVEIHVLNRETQEEIAHYD